MACWNKLSCTTLTLTLTHIHVYAQRAGARQSDLAARLQAVVFQIGQFQPGLSDAEQNFQAEVVAKKGALDQFKETLRRLEVCLLVGCCCCCCCFLFWWGGWVV